MRRPFVEAYVTILATGQHERVVFLLDTGADTTFLMPRDAGRLGVSFQDLARSPEVAQGIGGQASYYEDEATLTFFDRDFMYIYEVDLEIAEPSEHNRGFPSLLGRDIVSRWLLRYEAPRDVLEAEVDSADMVIPRRQ